MVVMAGGLDRCKLDLGRGGGARCPSPASSPPGPPQGRNRPMRKPTRLKTHLWLGSCDLPRGLTQTADTPTPSSQGVGALCTIPNTAAHDALRLYALTIADQASRQCRAGWQCHRGAVRGRGSRSRGFGRPRRSALSPARVALLG
jgi:hypothetical protein